MLERAEEWKYERATHWLIRLLACAAAGLAVFLISSSSAHADQSRTVVTPASFRPVARRFNFTSRRPVAHRIFSKRPRKVRIRSGRWSARPHVIAAARRYGVPARVALAVCYHESGCNCRVRRGRAGEIGPMQVMPATARAIGASLRGCQNQVEAGVRYLRMVLRAGRLCRYNSGVGRRCNRASLRYERMVRRVMRRL